MVFLIIVIVSVALIVLLCVGSCSISNDVEEELNIKYLLMFDVKYYMDHYITYCLIVSEKDGLLRHKLDYEVMGHLLTSDQRTGCEKTKYFYNKLLNGFGSKICSIENEEERVKYIKSFSQEYGLKVHII